MKLNKNELRIKYKNIRKEIFNKENKSLIITNKVINNPKYKSSKTIAIYMNNEDEVITKYLIEDCFKQNKKVCLPKVEGPNQMNFYYINPNEKLILSKYNILEPNNNQIVNKKDIELMIIPGICFDKDNNRIGYGKGYYDYYLNEINPYKLGICFKEQFLINETINSSENDIKMDKVITD